MNNIKNYLTKYFKYILLMALLYQPLFGHINRLPIREWDEARLAVNAYSMYKDGDLIVTHFDGPEMWNTKPPFFIWTQVICMKIFGVNELSVRLPSALAGLATCLALLFFVQRYMQGFVFGFIAVMVLITINGYIDIHSTRTGDYDAMLTLFTTLSCLSFFAYSVSGNTSRLYLFFLFTTLAVLTKGVAGLLFLPALIIYSFMQKLFVPLLKSKHFYIGLAGFIFLIAGYYLLRESKNPGYLQAVYHNELGGRFTNAQEGNTGGFWFYYTNLVSTKLIGWYLLVPCGFLVGLLSKNRKIKLLTIFLSICVTIFFLIISFSKTKLEWYIVPVLPLLAVIITIFINYIYDTLQKFMQLREGLNFHIMPYIFLFLIFIMPYQKIISKTYLPKDDNYLFNIYETGYYLQDAVEGKYNLKGQYLLFDGYDTPCLFYLLCLNEKGIHTEIKDWKKLNAGEVVFTAHQSIKKYLSEHYTCERISAVGNVETYKILDIIKH